MKKSYKIEGMTCTACAGAIEKTLKKTKGVHSVSVNFANEKMNIDYNEKILSGKDIGSIVEKTGYHIAYGKENNIEKKQYDHQTKVLRKRLIYSIVFTLPLLYISMGEMAGFVIPQFLTGKSNILIMALTQMLLTVPVLTAGRDFYIKGFAALIRRMPNMDSLIAVGSSVSFLYGVFAVYNIAYGYSYNNIELAVQFGKNLYFESAAVILTLITLGKFIESRAKGHASEAVRRLIELAPVMANVYRNKKEVEIPAEDIITGDTVIVRPGGRIPADGRIIKGNASIDESMLTGESAFKDKKEGDDVFSATVNKSGYIEFTVLKTGQDTVYSKIIKLVEQAQEAKPHIARLADKISAVFVPAVILISLCSFIIWLLSGKDFTFSLSMGISVLVISCPCALGLATPVAVVAAAGRGAQLGCLFKNGEALELLHKINIIMFDKTGTVTKGMPDLTDIYTKDEDKQEIIIYAASAEAASEHPISKAIIKKAKEMGLKLKEAYGFKMHYGSGISAEVEKMQVAVGNNMLMEKTGADIRDYEDSYNKYANEGKTPFYISLNNIVKGVIAVEDTIKKGSIMAVKELKNMGYKTVMITGDNKYTAEAAGKKAGIDNVIAEVFPDKKAEEVERFQRMKKHVAMVGDGINDAPALVKADIGISMGSGTDAAVESSDIVLMRNDLMDAVAAIKLGKKTIRIIRQNLFWAFFYNILGIPVAAGVFYTAFGIKLNPMIAAAAMSASSITVVFNALRLRVFNPAVKNKLKVKGEVTSMKKIE